MKTSADALPRLRQPRVTVFVVEDDPAVREALTLLLNQEGYAVEAFADGRAFLAAFAPPRPGCIVSDLSMPHMDGLELQRRLREQGVGTPMIFLTGNASVAASVQAVKAGAVDFLEKPVDPDALFASIDEALARDRETRLKSDERQQICRSLDSLTEREREVLALVAKGYASKEIAALLEISYRTVELHRARTMNKLNASSLANLVAIAIAGELVDPLS